MANINSIKIPNGSVFNFEDTFARESIEALAQTVGQINTFAYTVCKNAASTPQNVVWDNNGSAVTGTLAASEDTMYMIYLVPSTNGSGDVYDEYITLELSSGSYVWELFGNTDVHMSDLKALAFKDTASASYTPQGSVSQPTFTGNQLSSSGAYTPAGTVSAPAFTGTAATVSVKGTPSGAIGTGSGTPNYTPAGTVSTPVVNVQLNTASKYVASSATGGGSVTPGSAAACTMPSLTMQVVDGELQLNWSAGSFTPNTPTTVTLPSFASQTIATGVKSATASQPAFTGTGAELKFTGSEMTSSGSYTPAGSVEAPTFTGTQRTVTVTGTPTGTVSKPTFSGTQKTITVS